MFQKTVIIKPLYLVGMVRSMSLIENKTSELWKDFIKSINEIPNKKSAELISLQQYPIEYFEVFNPNAYFDKWACCEVNNFENVPANMKSILISGGLYAEFKYIGKPDNAKDFFQNVFQEWLPKSRFQLDVHRPHFEVMGDKYKTNDDLSEELVYIPII